MFQPSKHKKITKEDIKNKPKKTAHWISPGSDQDERYWLKNLTSLHERLSQQLQISWMSQLHAIMVYNR